MCARRDGIRFSSHNESLSGLQTHGGVCPSVSRLREVFVSEKNKNKNDCTLFQYEFFHIITTAVKWNAPENKWNDMMNKPKCRLHPPRLCARWRCVSIASVCVCVWVYVLTTVVKIQRHSFNYLFIYAIYLVRVASIEPLNIIMYLFAISCAVGSLACLTWAVSTSTFMHTHTWSHWMRSNQPSISPGRLEMNMKSSSKLTMIESDEKKEIVEINRRRGDDLHADAYFRLVPIEKSFRIICLHKISHNCIWVLTCGVTQLIA